MKQSWRYLIPSLLTLSYIYVSSEFHYGWFYVILLVANLLNAWWGEFSNEELTRELKFFYRSGMASVIKVINSLVLLGMIVWAVIFVDGRHFSVPELIGFSVTTGILTGCFIVTLAHDLLHSRSRFQKFLSILLLTFSGIPHFASEHLCGHHREIGLKEDPTTARLNQNFYAYFVKVTVSTLRSCYVTQFGLPAYMRRKIRLFNYGMLLMLLFTWAAILLFTRNPVQAFSFFVIQGFVSYFLYELINYIQHYGLFRGSKDDEITLRLSWNCYYKYTNYILFLLPLHSLHHLPSHGRKVQDFKDGPRMPYLYFVMVAMALIPPLWFYKMNNLVALHQQKI